ncbi:MAG TPA: LacI family DNA-binding transcriptional regulator [Chthoniobacteraceae bacterium]|nr:LacI family DNA-binding transcriptional regulator [Chthoniobacteraceae bacterium]
MAVTQQQIALEAQVPRSTVAAVMSAAQRGRISPEVRKKVMDAAHRLGYRPNRYAQVVRNGKSGYIGIINFGALRQLALRKVQVATETIRDLGYDWMVQQADWYSHDWARACDLCVQSLIDARVEGVLLVYPHEFLTQEHIGRFHKAEIPVVTIAGEHLQGVPKFVSDRQWGYRMITEHLLSLGRQRIVLMSKVKIATANGFYSAFEGYPALREQASVVTATEKRCEEDPCATVYLPGLRAMREILNAPGPRPDAVVCTNDQWAMGALRACAEAGVKVPEEIAVTGFDNDTAGAFGTVPLTTIDHPLEPISRQAVESLVGMIREKKLLSETTVTVRGKLVIRQSSGALPHPSLLPNSGTP